MIAEEHCQINQRKHRGQTILNQKFIQPIFQPHLDCDDHCQRFLNQSFGLFILEKIDYCLDIDLDQAINYLNTAIALQRQAKLQQKKVRKESKILSFPSNLTKKLLNIAEQFHQNQISSEFLAGHLGISIGRAKYLMKLISTNQQQSREKDWINFNDQHKKWIIQYLKQSNCENLQNCKQIFAEFQQAFSCSNQNPSFSRFYSWLRSLKLLTFRQQSQVSYSSQTRLIKYKRLEFSKQLVILLVQDAPIIYIDETSFGRNVKVGRCWQIRNKFPKLQIKPTSKKTKSVIGAISNTGFTAFKCLIGTVDSFVFADFLIELISLLKMEFSQNKIVLVLDNATYHRSQRIQHILKFINHIFLPPYTPQFNCIEIFWGLAKRKVAKAQYQTNIAELVWLHKTLSSFSRATIINLCRSNRRSLLAALEFKQF